MKSFYIEVTQDFVDKNTGYKSGCSIIGFGKTKDNKNVCSSNTLNDFPELFDPNNLPQIIQLDSDTDF
jgi:hypothetical protein